MQRSLISTTKHMADNVNLYVDNDDEKKDSERDHGASVSVGVSSQSTTRSAYEVQADHYSKSAKKIADSKWRQLRCKMSTMTYSANWVMCIFIIVAVICIPIGVLTFNLSQSVELSCPCPISTEQSQTVKVP